ncbi:importin subunit alpha-6/7 [Acrasis kona]|uniref:Importin subunit alpha n=1 Tax=Acrasis kona TaxID=1008807 RepID=A0AAW2YXS0_9EUKA
MFSNQEPTGRKAIKANTISADEARRKREDKLSGLRKQKKEQILQKRRKEAGLGETIHDPHVQEKLQQLPALVAQLNSADVSNQLSATVSFRKLLSMERNPPIDEVIAAGVVPRLIQLLAETTHDLLQFEACWALTNIASGTSDHTETVIKNNAVPLFISLIRSSHDDVKEQAIWALGNIAGDSAQCRNYVLQLGVMEPLLQTIINKPKSSVLRNATWILSNLCRGKPIPDFNLVSPALPVLCHLLYSTDEEVLTDSCWAISYLSDGPNDRIQAVIDSNVVNRMIELLIHHSPSVQTPALRTIGNIVTGSDSQTQTVINVTALNHLCSLLLHTKKSIKKEACWTISNITAGNSAQIKAIIDANLIHPLVQILGSADFDVKKEAAWAISNATSGGTDEQIHTLVQHGCIKPLCELLTVKDVKVINVALEGLENILASGARIAAQNDGDNPYTEIIEECGGVDKIEKLQTHREIETYEKAMKIIEEYYDGFSDEEEARDAPVADSQEYVFGSNIQQGGKFDFGYM